MAFHPSYAFLSSQEFNGLRIQVQRGHTEQIAKGTEGVYCGFLLSSSKSCGCLSRRFGKKEVVITLRETLEHELNLRQHIGTSDYIEKLLHFGESPANWMITECGFVTLERLILSGYLCPTDQTSQDFTAVNKRRRCILFQVLQGLAHLNEKEVVHGATCPENIILTRQGTVKLANFAMALKLPVREKNSKVFKEGFKSEYMAPEFLCQVHNNAQFDVGTDVWSFGVLLDAIHRKGETLLSKRKPRIFNKNDWTAFSKGEKEYEKSFLERTINSRAFDEKVKAAITQRLVPYHDRGPGLHIERKTTKERISVEGLLSCELFNGIKQGAAMNSVSGLLCAYKANPKKHDPRQIILGDTLPML